ncbi:hypothetical protein AO262_32345 [Pseudomonas fluorescens ABAC62]|nr:hypothetical protein AO262_32345 [Pseudomonas fluorescens ABAC62]
MIVDDHPAICMAVQMLLASEGYDVVADANNGVDALRLVESLCPLTLILDIGIPMIDGLAIIRCVTAKNLPVKIVVLTGFSSAHLSSRCRRMGAHGFVSKQSHLRELVNAVHAVRAGREYFPTLSPRDARQAHSAPEHRLLTTLSAREVVVMQQLLHGLSGKEIAQSMGLSAKTVSTYKKRIFYKLNVGTLMDLYALGERHRLI